MSTPTPSAAKFFEPPAAPGTARCARTVRTGENGTAGTTTGALTASPFHVEAAEGCRKRTTSRKLGGNLDRFPGRVKLEGRL